MTDKDDSDKDSFFQKTFLEDSQRAAERPDLIGQHARGLIAPGLTLSPEELAKIMLETFIEKGSFVQTAEEDHALVINLDHLSHLRMLNPETVKKAMDILTNAIGVVFSHDDALKTIHERLGQYIAPNYTNFLLIFDGGIDDPESIRTALKERLNILKEDIRTEACAIVAGVSETSGRVH